METKKIEVPKGDYWNKCNFVRTERELTVKCTDPQPTERVKAD